MFAIILQLQIFRKAITPRQASDSLLMLSLHNNSDCWCYTSTLNFYIVSWQLHLFGMIKAANGFCFGVHSTSVGAAVNLRKLFLHLVCNFTTFCARGCHKEGGLLGKLACIIIKSEKSVANKIKNDSRAPLVRLHLGIMRLRKKGKQIEMNFLIKIRSSVFLAPSHSKNRNFTCTSLLNYSF